MFTYASLSAFMWRTVHTELRHARDCQLLVCTQTGSESTSATLQTSSQQPTPAMAQPLQRCPMLPTSSAPVRPSQGRQTGRRRHSALSWLGHPVNSCAFSSQCGMHSTAQTCTEYLETPLIVAHGCHHQQEPVCAMASMNGPGRVHA